MARQPAAIIPALCADIRLADIQCLFTTRLAQRAGSPSTASPGCCHAWSVRHRARNADAPRIRPGSRTMGLSTRYPCTPPSATTCRPMRRRSHDRIAALACRDEGAGVKAMAQSFRDALATADVQPSSASRHRTTPRASSLRQGAANFPDLDPARVTTAHAGSDRKDSWGALVGDDRVLFGLRASSKKSGLTIGTPSADTSRPAKARGGADPRCRRRSALRRRSR